MPLPSPNLDDRTFDQLVHEAVQRIKKTNPEWTDLSVSDPGMVLVEVFAYLTETMLYRLNRIPEKAYVSFLRLLGLKLQPPAAASVQLVFSRKEPFDRAVNIPRGTRVTVSRSGGEREAPVFVLADAVTIPSGERQAEGTAYHCELVDAEQVGRGTGQPGQWYAVSRPPIIAPLASGRDLQVGVAANPDEAREAATFVRFGSQTYRIWSEVQNFSNLGPDRFVYTVDRVAGRIQFAPSLRMLDREPPTDGNGGTVNGGTLSFGAGALGEAPADGREIRVWYRRGGGPEGNVAAGTLTVFKDPIPGVEVTNPSPATGGVAGETTENALLRGPLEIHTLDRAVTARDFEQVALNRSRAIARARALTRADLWRHAVPGTVEVLLVPDLPIEARPDGRVTAAALRGQETDLALHTVQEALDVSRPLGTQCIANWVRCKTVQVQARIVVRDEEDPQAVRRRVLDRLHQTINPLPAAGITPGWPFGQALRSSQVYAIALAEPGVIWADRIKLRVEDVPDGRITAMAADFFQPETWYAASESRLYRTLNDGDSWELVGEFSEGSIKTLAVHPDQPGYVAVGTSREGQRQSRVYISSDCAENWQLIVSSENFEVNDVAWMARGGVPVLLLATSAGLFQIEARSNASLAPILVDLETPDLGFYAVTASRARFGQVNVAAAAVSTRGVYISSEGGTDRSFQHSGLRGEDIRVLEIQYDGPRAFLWSGAYAAGPDPGVGCFRWELLGAETPVDRWVPFRNGWAAGSVRAIAFHNRLVLAASYRGGVLELTLGDDNPKWVPSDRHSGLPWDEKGVFLPVNAIASDSMREGRRILAGSEQGVYRRHLDRDGDTYRYISDKEFSDRVALPPTWLFCSGDHQIESVRENEAERD
jgi:hypothetical protein